MKRLLFVPGFTADTYNTIQRRYVALTEHLRDRLELVWCLPPDDPEEWIWADEQRKRQTPPILAALDAIGARVVRRPVHRGSAWRRARTFAALLSEGEFDGVYAVFAHRFPPLYAGRRAGLTTIWDAAWNSLEPPHRFPRAKALFYRRCVDRFIAATPLIARSLASHGIPEDRIFVRWSGIDTAAVPRIEASAARDELHRELGLPASSRIVLQLTSYLPSKNTCMAVRVASLVRARAPELQWLLAGEPGPDTPAVVDLARKLSVGSCVHVLGHRSDVWKLMACADVVALTSRQDGLPNALLEAMVAGRPIVTTRAHGPEYIVADGENGFLAAPDDDAGFAERVVALLSDHALCEAMGQRGRRRVERDFALDRWCERLGDYLLDCLGGARVAVRPKDVPSARVEAAPAGRLGGG